MRRAARLALPLLTAAVVLALSKVHAAWVAERPYDLTGSARFTWALTYIGLLAVAAYGSGLPDLARTGRAAVGSSVAAVAGGALGISAIQLVLGSALLPRFVVFGTALLLTPLYVALSGVSQGGRARAEQRDRVVAVCRPDESAALAEDLMHEPERPAVLAAALTPEQAKGAGERDRPLVERAVTERASVLVLDNDAQADATIVAQAAALHENGVRVRTLSLFYDEWLGKLPISELERVALLFDIGEVHRARYGRAKRVLDIAVGVAGVPVLLAVAPLVVAGNLVANRGPLLYRQDRVGRHGRTFHILKFRTMRPEGEAMANEWTAEDDPRITPFGKLLRRTHLDELPQVINILRGDLALVGPRPEQPRYVAELLEKIPYYDVRHLVRPGLTGWAQVKYGYAGNESDAVEKLQYEFYYLRHQELALDLRILGRTIRSVLGRRGR